MQLMCEVTDNDKYIDNSMELNIYLTANISEKIRFEYFHRISLPFGVMINSPVADAAIFSSPTCCRVVDVSSILPPSNVMFSTGEQVAAVRKNKKCSPIDP